MSKPNYLTAIATDLKLCPVSYLHIERNDADFDKLWTVCTHPEYRGKGFSSFILSNSLKKQKNDKKKKYIIRSIQ